MVKYSLDLLVLRESKESRAIVKYSLDLLVLRESEGSPHRHHEERQPVLQELVHPKPSVAVPRLRDAVSIILLMWKHYNTSDIISQLVSDSK